jgi:hypothetical protein
VWPSSLLGVEDLAPLASPRPHEAFAGSTISSIGDVCRDGGDAKSRPAGFPQRGGHLGVSYPLELLHGATPSRSGSNRRKLDRHETTVVDNKQAIDRYPWIVSDHRAVCSLVLPTSDATPITLWSRGDAVMPMVHGMGMQRSGPTILASVK